MKPPGASIDTACSRISSWRSAQPAGLPACHSPMASAWRRNMPSPEQGASTRMRSKYAGKRGASWSGMAQVTTALATPMRSMLRERICARAGTGSLHTSRPRPCMSAAIWVLLPPGAAHRSSTRSPGCGSSALTADSALGSCR